MLVLTIFSQLYTMFCFTFWQGGFTQINCNTDIFIGGVPSYDEVKNKSGIRRPFSGSIQKVRTGSLAPGCRVTLTPDSGIENCDQCSTRCTQGHFERVLTCLRFHL